MVKIGLQIKTFFQNIETLELGEDYNYHLKLKCSSCGEISDKWQVINASDKIETVRSETNYLAKCKLCSRENSMDVLTDTKKKYTNEDEGKLKTVVVFDCRGIEPVEFQPEEGWQAKAANSSKIFNEFDLNDGMWADYDDKANESVEINDFEWNFIKVK